MWVFGVTYIKISRVTTGNRGNSMGKIKAEQIPKTMQFLQADLPALLLAVGKIEDSDEYWQEVIHGCNVVYEKHKNDFAKDMLLAFANYLEKQSKKKRGVDVASNKSG